EEIPGAHRVFRIEEKLAEAGEVRGPGDLRQDRAPAFDRGLTGDPAGEVEPQEPAAGDARAHAHETSMVEQRHPRAGARPARRRPTRPPAPRARTRPRRSAR